MDNTHLLLKEIYSIDLAFRAWQKEWKYMDYRSANGGFILSWIDFQFVEQIVNKTKKPNNPTSIKTSNKTTQEKVVDLCNRGKGSSFPFLIPVQGEPPSICCYSFFCIFPTFPFFRICIPSSAFISIPFSCSLTSFISLNLGQFCRMVGYQTILQEL